METGNPPQRGGTECSLTAEKFGKLKIPSLTGLVLNEIIEFVTIFDFHVKSDMPILHYLIFPELSIPTFQYSNCRVK